MLYFGVIYVLYVSLSKLYVWFVMICSMCADGSRFVGVFLR